MVSLVQDLLGCPEAWGAVFGAARPGEETTRALALIEVPPRPDPGP